MKDFNAELETQNIIEFVQKYYKEHNLGGAVIGISGGKDSAVVAALMCKAIGKQNVLGVWMPCHSKSEDKEDAKAISNQFGFEMIEFDLTNTYESFKSNVQFLGTYTDEDTKNSDINLKPRLRMGTLYYIAALQTKVKSTPYLVVGTSNKCELYVGYFTKGGDSTYDISLIADFTVDEVIKIGEYLKVLPKVLYKTPDDGLSNETDEEKLGVKYKDITSYINGEKVSSETVKERIETLHKNSQHKFDIPTYRRNKKS